MNFIKKWELPTMKKVLFLISQCNCGGLENYLLRFLTFSKRDNYTVCCTLGSTQGELSEDYKRVCRNFDGIHFSYINPLSWIKFYFYLKHGTFDVICDFHGDFAGIPLLLAKIAGISKRISSYRQSSNLYQDNFINRCYSWVTNRIVRMVATEIISNSEVALDYFHPYWRRKSDKFTVIRNGINANYLRSSDDKLAIRKEFNIPVDAFLIGHISRFHTAKNHETILKTAALLEKRDRRIHFLFCGKGVPENLAKKVKEMGLEKQVHLTSYRKDIGMILQSLDLFYFPSITEGQPNALLEAMIADVPFLASDIPSIRESIPVVQHKHLLQIYDYENAAKVIQRLVESKSLRKAYSCADWAIKCYNPARCFADFENLLLNEK